MKTKIKSILYALSVGLLTIPGLALAQFSSPDNSYGTYSGSFGEFVRVVLKYILSAIAILAMLGIVIGGIWYIISGGEKEKMETAKGWIMYSIIGLVIALIGYAIVYTIGEIISGNNVKF